MKERLAAAVSGRFRIGRELGAGGMATVTKFFGRYSTQLVLRADVR